MKIIIFSIFLFSVSANAMSGAYLIDQFRGTYKVASRTCTAGDMVCENIVAVTVGYDKNKLQSFVTETFQDNSTNTIWLYEGTGVGKAYIVGTLPTDGQWNEQVSANPPMSYAFRSVLFKRNYSGSPVTYFYNETGGTDPQDRRRLELQ